MTVPSELRLEPGLSPRAKAKRLLKRAARPLGFRLGVFNQYAPRPLETPDADSAPPLPDPPPVIGLVTPSFEQGRFLEATIRSVLDQHYPALRYAVQDGGSSDGSREILQRYEANLAHVASAPDGGQADAINRGFKRLLEEPEVSILGWLNSDDLLLPGALATIAATFDAHPEVDIVYGDRIVIDAEGREVGRWLLPGHAQHAYLWRDYVPQETMFWRRSIFDRVGPRVDDEYEFAIDWELILRFHRADAWFHHVPRCLGAFRTHDAQKSIAQRESVGQPEFDRLRAEFVGSGVNALMGRIGSAAYAAASIPAAWRHDRTER